MFTALCRISVVVAALAGTASADTLKVGDRLAELDVAVDARGKPFKLKALKGKWLVVTVGAAWCKPCAKELPAWDKIAGAKAGKVTFISIAIDDEIADGKRFHDKLKLKNLLRVYMPNDKSSVGGNYGSDTMPTSFLADPQGVVRYVHKGFNSGDEKKLIAEIDKLVKP
ncbi:MAG: TlpA family protein disulfide reductase [Myxococcales bacterium]|nr:TlpA family protein disulfide reductase [Myxococcales bacterium]